MKFEDVAYKIKNRNKNELEILQGMGSRRDVGHARPPGSSKMMLLMILDGRIISRCISGSLRLRYFEMEIIGAAVDLKISDKAKHLITLKFENVAYKIKNSKKNEREIFKGISDTMAPGEMLSMLCPSGSGKRIIPSISGNLGVRYLEMEMIDSAVDLEISEKAKHLITLKFEDVTLLGPSNSGKTTLLNASFPVAYLRYQTKHPITLTVSDILLCNCLT